MKYNDLDLEKVQLIEGQISIFDNGVLFICATCKCNTCVNNVDNEYSNEGNKVCLNCDECYYYGMDHPEYTINIKIHECKDYKESLKSIERIEKRAEKMRKSFKILRGQSK